MTTRVGVDASMAPRVKEWFRGLLYAPNGILFEDASVMVGVQAQFNGSAGRMMLHFRNRAAVPLTAFKVRIPPQAQLKVELKDEVPSVIGVGEAIKVPVTLECMQPFQDPPALQVSFLSVPGTGHAYPLRLPVAVASFVEDVAMGPADFEGRWMMLTGEPRERSFSVPSSGPVSAEGARQLLASLRCQARADAATLPGRFAGSFRTATISKTGDRISVGILAQAVPNGMTNSYDVTIRSQHGDVTSALARLLTA